MLRCNCHTALGVGIRIGPEWMQESRVLEESVNAHSIWSSVNVQLTPGTAKVV